MALHTFSDCSTLPLRRLRLVFFSIVGLTFGLLGISPLSQAATLSGTVELLTAGTNVNLTAEGKLDWTHWGLLTEQSANHKYGLASQISFTPIVSSAYDGPYRQSDSVNGFLWNDGTPTLAASNTITGLLFYGLNHGFQIQVPADKSPKRLKLYVGSSGARVKLTAILSGAPGYTNNASDNLGTGPNGVCTLDFQAGTAAQTLTVTVTVDALYNSGGSVSLFAATLVGDNIPPTSAIITPTNQSIFVAPANVSLTAMASDSDGTITNLEIFRGSTKVGQSSTSPVSITVSNLATNTYTFIARATDNRGLSSTSMPVTVYVTTGGGTLLGTVSTPPSQLNVSAEGRLDWAHWGLSSASSLNRKTGVTSQIPDIAPLGIQRNKIEQYADNFTAYSWTNGTPTTSAAATTTGIFAAGLSKGFQLTVPATPALRRLKIYVGVYGAQGKFEASLSDGSGPPFTDSSLESAYENGYAVYTLTFASRVPSATLLIRWTSSALYDATYGNVTWQAATLSDLPQVPLLQAASDSQGDLFHFTFGTQLNWNYQVRFTEILYPLQWQVLTNLSGTGTNVDVFDSKAGRNRRYYRVTVE